MDQPWIDENTAARKRLHHVATRLGDADLRRTLPNGLSIASTLVHLAFWDRYCRALLRAWEQTGPVKMSANFDAVNEALAALAATIPEREAVGLVLDAADDVDDVVEALDPQLAASIAAGDNERLLYRVRHRSTHLDQIELVLAHAG